MRTCYLSCGLCSRCEVSRSILYFLSPLLKSRAVLLYRQPPGMALQDASGGQPHLGTMRQCELVREVHFSHSDFLHQNICFS